MTGKPWVVEVTRKGKVDRSYFKTEKAARRFANGARLLRKITFTRKQVSITVKKRNRNPCPRRR